MSRSQFNEDVFIYEKYFHGKTQGTYFEAGALDGKRYSNTALFAQKGFTGVLVEPTSSQFKRLTRNRPHDQLWNCVIGPPGEVKFQTSRLFPAINSQTPLGFWKFVISGTETVSSVPLHEILKGQTSIDFFSLDVEGHELQVLRTMDWNIPVKVWLIENHESGEDFHKIRRLLSKKGYKFSERIHFNDVFIHTDTVGRDDVRYKFRVNDIPSIRTVVGIIIVVLLLRTMQKSANRT